MNNLLKKNILGITLARAGSKGIKNKNIKLLNGKPLLAYTIIESLKSKYLDEYIISSDSEEIRQIALDYGAIAPFSRPSKFAGDTASSVAALQHAVNWMENEKNIKYDYVIEVMCTNPFKTYIDIEWTLTRQRVKLVLQVIIRKTAFTGNYEKNGFTGNYQSNG